MEEDSLHLMGNCYSTSNKRKRRHSSCEQKKISDEESFVCVPESKLRILDGVEPFCLLEFSDEMLYEIFQYLDTWTLMALMDCCSRLKSFIFDHRFWNNIDLSKESLPLGILADVLERSHSNTVSIKLHGPPISQHFEYEDKKFNQTLAKVFATCCTNLSVLELQGISIDFRFVRITEFPASLKRLVLNNCSVRFEGEKNIFFGIDTHLTGLEELYIENSSWFEPYYMMVFSKLPELRALSLRGCQLLSDFVPYGSMAARFGFKKLEYLDLRFTPICDPDLQCFNAVATLKEVRLDCPEPLRNNYADYEETATKPRSCSCNSRGNQENFCSSEGNNECPSTSSAAASHIMVTVSPSSSNNHINNNNDNEASTSSAAAAKAAATQPSEQSQNMETPQQQAPQQCEDESSLSSSSNSPSSSSSSSNDSLPSLSTNSTRSSVPAAVYIGELPVPGGNAPPFSRFLPRHDQVLLLDLRNRWRQARSALVNQGVEQLHQQQQQQQQPPQPPPQLQPRIYYPNNNNNNNHNNPENMNGNLQNGNAGNQIDQVLHHPLFWDMINPFSERRALRRNGRHEDNEALAGVRSRRLEFRRCQYYHQHRQQRNRLHHQQISDRGVCCFGRPLNPVEHGIIWIRIGNRPSENRFERLCIRNYKLVTDISLKHLVQCSPYLVYLDLSGTSVTQRGIDTFKEQKPQCEVIADHLRDGVSNNTSHHDDDDGEPSNELNENV